MLYYIDNPNARLCSRERRHRIQHELEQEKSDIEYKNTIVFCALNIKYMEGEN